MKKETIIALILGISTGAVIALVLLFFVKEKSLQNKKVLTPKNTPASVKETQQALALTITSPDNRTTVSTDEIEIVGTVAKGSLITISSPLGESAQKVTTGSFRSSIPLQLGDNTIKVSAYNENSTDEKTLKIYLFE